MKTKDFASAHEKNARCAVLHYAVLHCAMLHCTATLRSVTQTLVTMYMRSVTMTLVTLYA